MNTETVDPSWGQGMTEALQVIAQQAAVIVEMQQQLAKLSESAASGGLMARGAGERIKLVDLVAKAKASMTTTTARTYSGCMDLLVKDMGLLDADGKPWRGLGDKWADEVLTSHLRTALGVVTVRARARAEERARVREAAGRAVRSSQGDAAQYNAIGAWRCLFAGSRLSRGSTTRWRS